MLSPGLQPGGCRFNATSEAASSSSEPCPTRPIPNDPSALAYKSQRDPCVTASQRHGAVASQRWKPMGQVEHAAAHRAACDQYQTIPLPSRTNRSGIPRSLRHSVTAPLRHRAGSQPATSNAHRLIVSSCDRYRTNPLPSRTNRSGIATSLRHSARSGRPGVLFTLSAPIPDERSKAASAVPQSKIGKVSAVFSDRPAGREPPAVVETILTLPCLV
jgi:hypothetical protein